MIPLLHRSVTNLAVEDIIYDNGIPLVDVTECKVKEQLNGTYELSMTYPVGGFAWDQIVPGCIIISKVTEVVTTPTQAFDVVKVTRNMNSITVSAQHISYRMKALLCAPTSGISTVTALRSYLQTATNVQKNFFTFFFGFSGNVAAEPISFDKPRSLYDLIYGGSNSILKAFPQTEIVFNRRNLAFQINRGTRKLFTIKYAINMLSFSQGMEAPDQVQYVYPYAILEKNAEDKTKTYIDLLHWPLGAPIIDVAGVSYQSKQASADITELLQWSGYNYYDDVRALSRTSATNIFRQKAEQWVAKNQSPLTPSALTVSYIDLAKTAEYSFLQAVQIGVGDLVTVEYPYFGISEEKEVTSVTYDVMRESNESIQIGTPNPSVVEQIAAKLREVKR